MDALIMAAGMGTRFGDMTAAIPKGFIPVGGKPMVERSIETLLRCGVKRIIIGTGYHREAYEALKERYPGIVTCLNPEYADTNSMYTLWNCRDLVTNDFLLLESDLIFDDRAIKSLLETPRETAMLVTPVRKFQDQYYVEADCNGNLIACSTERSLLRPDGEMVGIHKLSLPFYRAMCDDYGEKRLENPKLGYEYELLHMSRFGHPVHVLVADDVNWYEIDDEADLAYAEANVIQKIEEKNL